MFSASYPKLKQIEQILQVIYLRDKLSEERTFWCRRLRNDDLQACVQFGETEVQESHRCAGLWFLLATWPTSDLVKSWKWVISKMSFLMKELFDATVHEKSCSKCVSNMLKQPSRVKKFPSRLLTIWPTFLFSMSLQTGIELMSIRLSIILFN